MRLLALGMPRSGTSLLVRTLETLGLWAGGDDDFNPPTEHDPEGHREHRLVWGLNESALAWIDRAWDRPTDIDWSRLAEARRADVLGAIDFAVKTLDEHPDWVTKDPRLCLTLPLWREVIEPACIVVHRNPLEVARSLQSRDGLPIAAGIEMWEAYVRQAIANSDGLDRLFIDHAQLIAQPDLTATRLDEWLAVRRTLPRTTDDVEPPVRRTLVRHHSTPDETRSQLTTDQLQLLDDIDRLIAEGRG